MEDTKWERYAALGGVVFVVMNVIGSLLPGQPPSADDPPAKFTAFVKDHAGSMKISQYLAGIGTIGLLWWLGSLWRMMSRAEGERPRLAIVSAASLVMGGALAMASGAMTATVALHIDDIGDGSKFFFQLSSVLLGMAGFAVVAFLSAACALNYRTKMMPMWTSYVGWVSAAGFVVASYSVASDSSALGLIGLVSFFAWCVWILSVSSFMWRGASATS